MGGVYAEIDSLVIYKRVLCIRIAHQREIDSENRDDTCCMRFKTLRFAINQLSSMASSVVTRKQAYITFLYVVVAKYIWGNDSSTCRIKAGVNPTLTAILLASVRIMCFNSLKRNNVKTNKLLLCVL